MSRQPPRHPVSRTTQAMRLLAVLLLCVLALQAFFTGRVALIRIVNPASTAVQRSEMWRLLTERGTVAWAQGWVPGNRMADTLKRAVIASEDASFVDHAGVDWDAVERAWDKNQQASERANAASPSATGARANVKRVGGSTITQQLAKNLLLSGERTVLRKGQELVIASSLEALLGKRRILEVYLNHVEWGEGLFGAQMAARFYHRVDASKLSTAQAARLAVMLPAPKRFEKRPDSPYVRGRAAVVAARMPAVELP